jgi:hypothetical protein
MSGEGRLNGYQPEIVGRNAVGRFFTGFAVGVRQSSFEGGVL